MKRFVGWGNKAKAVTKPEPVPWNGEDVHHKSVTIDISNIVPGQYVRIEGEALDGSGPWAKEGFVRVDEEGDRYVDTGTSFLENYWVEDHLTQYNVLDVRVIHPPVTVPGTFGVRCWIFLAWMVFLAVLTVLLCVQAPGNGDFDWVSTLALLGTGATMFWSIREFGADALKEWRGTRVVNRRLSDR